jgi:hypothetical protein
MMLVALLLVQLTSPHGDPVYVNPAEVSTLREPTDVSGHWAPGTRCIVTMTNGKFHAVTVPCQRLRKALGALGAGER